MPKEKDPVVELVEFIVSYKFKGKGAWYTNQNTINDRGLVATGKEVLQLLANDQIEEVRAKKERR